MPPAGRDDKPLIALTMGDPAGVGPETVVRCWSDPRVHAACRPIVVGHPTTLRRAIALVGHDARVELIDSVTALRQLGQDPSDAGTFVCLPVGNDDATDVADGAVDPRSGQSAYESVVRAARGAMAGQFDALATAPLSKSALNAAGRHYPGHTELLAELCGVDDFAMMLYLPPEELTHSLAGLGVVHTTLHCALRDALGQLSTDRIVEKCRLAHAAMKDGFGLAAPRIGVCALNPHAGEDGLFGNEEQEMIAPAVEQTRREGIEATGPLPADTLMARAAAGEFDGVVAMYHDQGHIALKLLGMHRAVNITLGLPIIRTSAAHGTAFDIAWQGKASGSGMTAAILAAASLARRGFRFRCEDTNRR